ncbi:Aim3p LALA0_S03e04962g [Lachancea lanzarotensis]|uniref:LALA0S03e04962g1_1 n=1 Tax=Lachancea lanzarotensis TaxID=1245769 RepID=A0A0C7MNX6_9SACH|nr:uncharacterized protein LALA0_S03e04962g [Lachancea lanzarotensis]CEP61532.1 LALA0S03e04962g1_1 [Lachancea lanzarotensis]
MSDFWDQNKGSIKSGLATAGKVGYQGTKFVAKTGYKAGKQHYNNSRGITTSERSDSDSSSLREATPVSSLPDVSNLPPPPLKPGQASYHGKRELGNTNTTTTTTTATTVRIPPTMPQRAVVPQSQRMYPEPIQMRDNSNAPQDPVFQPLQDPIPLQSPIPVSSNAAIPPTSQLGQNLSTNVPIAAHPSTQIRPGLPTRASTTRSSVQALHLDTAPLVNDVSGTTSAAIPVASVPAQISAPAQVSTRSTPSVPIATSAPNVDQNVYPAVGQPDSAQVPIIPQRNYFRAPAALPITTSQPPAIEQVEVLQDPNSTPPGTLEEVKSPSITVRPYEWKDPEEKREQALKNKLAEVDISALSPPPTHQDRSPVTSGSSSPRQTLKSPLSTKPRASSILTQHSGKSAKSGSKPEGNEERPLERGIAGNYTNTGVVNFPPPPKASRTGMQPRNTASSKPSTPQTTGGRQLPRKPTGLPPRSNVPTSVSLENLPPMPTKLEPQEAQTFFQPPPKPFRKDTRNSPQPPPAPPRRSTPSTNLDTDETKSVPPPYSVVAIPPRNTVDVTARNSPKPKKAPPPKKSLPQHLQNINNDTITSTVTDDGEKKPTKIPPQKPARKNIAAPPPKPTRKPNLPSTNSNEEPIGDTNGLNAELMAKFKSRQPTVRPQLAQVSTSSFIASDNIRPAAPPIRAEQSTNPVPDLDDGSENPFQRYLKNVVPMDDDRLHKS